MKYMATIAERSEVEKCCIECCIEQCILLYGSYTTNEVI